MELINSYLTSDKLEAMTGNTKTPFNELYNLYEKDILTLAKEQTTEENEADFTESKLKMGVFNAIKTLEEFLISDLSTAKQTISLEYMEVDFSGEEILKCSLL